MAKFGKKNKVSLNPLGANICLLGLPKIGKTTIMKEIAEKYTDINDDSKVDLKDLVKIKKLSVGIEE